MKCNVFYESWQMECCGTAFSVGDTVKWLVYKAEQLNTPVDIGEINYCYEAHSSDWENILVLEGRVETIKILYQKYVPSIDNSRLLVPISGETVSAKRVEGFEEKLNDMEQSGHIVGLNDCTIRPAAQEEVSFK